MKQFFIALVVILFMSSLAVAAEMSQSDYAQTIRDNNQKISTFILDTIKLPYVLMGGFSHMNHEKAKEELDYEGHEDSLKKLQENWGKGSEECVSKSAACPSCGSKGACLPGCKCSACTKKTK